MPTVRKLFISYRNSSNDARKADALARQLRQQCFIGTTAPRYEVWQDKVNLAPACPNWWDEIVKAIEACDALVFALSADSLTSVICLAEIDYAHRRGRVIIPIVLEDEYELNVSKYDLKPATKKNVPAWLSQQHYLFDDGAELYPRINDVMDRYERDGFPLDIHVKPPLDPNKPTSNTRMYQSAVAYAEQQAFKDAQDYFHELTTRKDLLYGEDARQWIELIELYKDLLEMNHPATHKQFNQQAKAYQARFPVDFIEGIFDPHGLFATTPTPPQKDEGKIFAEHKHILWRNTDYSGSSIRLKQDIKNYDRTIALNPADADAYNNRGNAYICLGQYERAIENYDYAIQLKPDYALFYHNRGFAHDKLKQYRLAINDYDRAIALKPDYNLAMTYNNRGNAYFNLEQNERAIADYSQAIILNPHDATVYTKRGFTYQKLEQYRLAIADYDKAIILKPDDIDTYYNAYTNRGLAYGDLQQHKRAIADFDRAIAFKPANADAYIGRAIAYESMGNKTSAKADYCKALQLNPNDKFVRSILKSNGWSC